MIRVGLNGFGRIERVVTRILSTKRKYKLVLINEIDDDVQNLAYLFKYDSIYGKFKGKVTTKVKNSKIYPIYSLVKNAKRKLIIYDGKKLKKMKNFALH